ncbi:RNA polymerase factor sigma-54 [Mesobacillus harenae]|uniref:RNA polymerase factor sigma-54 n=1 Tax=Mesobacillus harenae TaxID=2213203 RepID=UPI00157FCA41|nr:RNA polymerase factor sigma-54 [Mesobacillus harenae]
MDLKAGLWQKQSLKLAMTQELSQAIALLQYTAQELNAFLESKAMENPLIQVEPTHVRAMDPRVDRIKSFSKSSQRELENWIEKIGEQTSTLEDHLLSQLIQYTDKQKHILKQLIGSIDENGYLGINCEEFASQSGISLESVEECLELLHALEPAGIGARNLQECLKIQLEKKKPVNQLAISIISDHFMLFADKKWKTIASLLGVNIKEIQKVFDEIQTLNPRPGAVFKRETSVYVIPDVVIRRVEDSVEVSVFEETVPKITFNESYYQELAAHGDGEVAKFLHEKQQDYHWILKSLEQRKETLIRVALKIVEKQQEFFRLGTQYLRPMTMREVSEELGIHESTVSRAVRGKYAQTPFGTLELRSFFTSAIQSTDQENASSQQAKDAIENLVKSEDKRKPLSDQGIAELLQESEGIVISRRTVAKYRDQLGIASSSKRKRFE